MTIKRLPVAVQTEMRNTVINEVLRLLVEADPNTFEQVERISNTNVVVRLPIGDVMVTFTAKNERVDIDFEVEEYMKVLADEEAKVAKRLADEAEKLAKAEARKLAKEQKDAEKAAKAKAKAEAEAVVVEVEVAPTE